MGKKVEKGNNGRKIDLNSKFLRILLLILMVFLIFAGPTYFSYLLFDVLNLSYLVSIITGFFLFVAGLLLMWFLIRKKIIN
jgi:hypothetical protein